VNIGIHVASKSLQSNLVEARRGTAAK